MARSVLLALASVAAAVAASPLNVVYIVVDDLRPQIEAYNITDAPSVLTPNLNKLASESTVFRRAYCNQAVCSPSRNSFLWGRRPRSTKIWNFKSSTRRNFPHWMTLPQYFKEQLGYLTFGQGKIFHPGHPKDDDQPDSWTTAANGGFDYFDPNHQITICDETYGGHPLACAIPDNTTVDFVLANSSVTKLGEVVGRTGKQPPLFMALGHLKPHPFVAVPQSAYDMYPMDEVSLPKYPEYISNMRSDPEPSFYSCHSVNGRDPLALHNITIMPYRPIPDNLTRIIRQAYWAGTSHTDEQIGKTLDRMQELGMMDNTIIIMHADHGWGLGEGAEFCKMGDSEHRTRVPFMIRVPGGRHQVVEEPVELVSVMNTAIELATGQAPPASLNDGVSYADVVLGRTATPQPPQGFDQPLAFSTYPRCFNSANPVQNPCIQVKNTEFSHMGLTVRSRNFRYTEWRLWNGSDCTPRFDVDPAEITLFDHTSDPGTTFDGAWEQLNVVSEAQYASVVKQHAAWVRQQWKQGWGQAWCGLDQNLPMLDIAREE